LIENFEDELPSDLVSSNSIFQDCTLNDIHFFGVPIYDTYIYRNANFEPLEYPSDIEANSEIFVINFHTRSLH